MVETVESQMVAQLERTKDHDEHSDKRSGATCRGDKVGEGVVGYKIRGTTVAGPNCKLLFCTTGVILRRLANEGQKWMFSPKTVTHLLVDEVHERGVDTDFMLTYLREIQAKRHSG